MCPLYKTIGMMRAIVSFFDYAKKAIVESSGDQKITFNLVLKAMKPSYLKLPKMKFEDPKKSK
jgi:V-type H+-transporting ATPase subunit A